MKQGIETRVQTSSTADPSVQELVEKNALLEQGNLRLKSKYEALLEQIRLFQRQRFGASSEKCPADQQDLFNEAEALVDEEEAVTQGSSDVLEAAAASASEEKRPASATG
jgi:hypothetical protein